MSEIAQPPVKQPAKEKVSLSSILIWVIVIGLLTVVGLGLLDSRVTRPEAGAEAPVFEMQFFDGYEWQGRPAVSLEDMQGQIVVLNFWASWCVECRVEADVFEQTWRKYADQGVVFLGIAYADVEPNSIAYMEEFNLTYPHAPDLGTDISEIYEITGVPETFIIDKSGEIAHVQIGPINEAQLDSILSQLVAEGG